MQSHVIRDVSSGRGNVTIGAFVALRFARQILVISRLRRYICCRRQQHARKIIPAKGGSSPSVADWEKREWKGEDASFDACTRNEATGWIVFALLNPPDAIRALVQEERAPTERQLLSSVVEAGVFSFFPFRGSGALVPPYRFALFIPTYSYV